MRFNLDFFKAPPSIAIYAKTALKLVVFLAGLFAAYFLAVIVCANISTDEKLGTFENGEYMDDKFANFMVDSTCDFAATKELDTRLKGLLEALNAGGGVYLSDALKDSNPSYEALMLALFRMNRFYYYAVEQNSEKMFKIESGGLGAEIGFSDNPELVVVSNSSFKFLKDGTYESLELRKLFKMKR